MRLIPVAVVGAAWLVSLPLARAQDAVPDHPALRDKFYIGAGAFVPKTSTSAQLDSTNLG